MNLTGRNPLEHDTPFSVAFTHRLRFTHNVLATDNPTLASSLHDPTQGNPAGDAPTRVLAWVDQGVLNGWPELADQLATYADAHRSVMTLAGPVRTVPGGEACKNDRAVFETICQAIHDAELCRHSYVVVIGGGAVLDVVGFAAAIAHRGVRLVRIPTTTLAQADAGVGVKNGINAFGKKNYFGTFSPPWAVINDEQWLTSLPDRDWRCGFAEAVKVALVKDRALFDQIAAATDALTPRDLKTAVPIIRHSAQLHLRHITDGGDPFELTQARPLDFGHWAAHKLEQITDYQLRHGEAVAIGIALDATYSAMTGLLAPSDANTITDLLTRLGFGLYHDAMQETQTLLAGLDEFRQHLGGTLRVPLLTGIGQSIDVHTIDSAKMLAAIEQLATEPVCS